MKVEEDGKVYEVITTTTGTKWWYLNGQLHREDGPAVEWSNGDKFWFLNGKEYNEENYYKQLLKKSKVNKKLTDKKPKVDFEFVKKTRTIEL